MRDDLDAERKINALLSFYFKIPFPEELSDEIWAEKWHQLQWLAEQKLIASP